jgi:hypothetical protein
LLSKVYLGLASIQFSKIDQFDSLSLQTNFDDTKMKKGMSTNFLTFFIFQSSIFIFFNRRIFDANTAPIGCQTKSGFSINLTFLLFQGSAKKSRSSQLHLMRKRFEESALEKCGCWLSTALMSVQAKRDYTELLSFVNPSISTFCCTP